MRIKEFILVSFAFTSFIIADIEHSIVPSLEKFEKLENFSEKKYSKNQYAKISSALERKEEKIRLASYNMLFNLYDHNLQETNRWPSRMMKLVELIFEMDLDILATQELYPEQVDSILPHLVGYSFFSKSEKVGELNGFFYRTDRFEVLESKTWSMTQTPEVPSRETLTMLNLKDQKTGKSFFVFNTHLAFGNVEKREFQAKFIKNLMKPYTKEGPTLFMGDLNTFPHRLDLTELPFYDGDYIHRILKKGGLKEAREVSLLGHLGPMSTFTNAPEGKDPFEGTGTPGVFLDHVYVSKKVLVLMHAIQPGKVDGSFPSDHMPIIVDFVINN